jgi:imidazolonepropionase-like amidohydrolase/ABC-type multidrug transport system permease subunit
MKAYLALTQNELRLAFRDKQVLFFNYLFPLIFFFFLSAMLHAERGGSTIAMIVTNVLVIGILGNGFFGAGIRAVQEREQNILRRFKVTPISPLPILGASLTTGLLLFIPAIALTLTLARVLYGMPVPDQPISLFLFLVIGAVAFRSIGLIIAAVSNSTGESNMLVQLLYMPMMFLSGAMIPSSMLPQWTQTVAQFLPASYLVSGMQGIITQHESLAANWQSAGALIITLCLALFVATRLFRWEKDEKLKASSKLWVLGVMLPFVLLGIYQFRTSEQIVKNRMLWRNLQRGDSFLIRNAKVFTGDGRVIESGSVLVRKGKIEAVYEGAGPDAASLKADIVEASGKTVMPGLIDVHVHVGAPGGAYADMKDYMSEHVSERALAQYLYSGVTTVKSTGDTLDTSIALRKRVADGDLLGSELFVSGPLFTTEGGHGTEYFSWLEGPAKAAALEQFARTPTSPAQAREQVRQLKNAGVDAIKAVLETGRTGMLFARMDLAMFRAVVEEAGAQTLPASVHTGNARDVEDAVDAGAASIEHGSFNDTIPDAVLAKMARNGIAYDPTLSVLEAVRDFAAGKPDLLRRSLVQQAVSQKLLLGTAAAIKDAAAKNVAAGTVDRAAGIEGAIRIAKDNLLRAWKAGVPLVTGSDAGNLLVFHGPTVHREMQLWVEAGIPPAVALQAATGNAAKLLRADARIGLIVPGHDANLLLVDGDPTREISATERISMVVLKGERVRRVDLFDAAKNPLQ